MDEKVLEWLVSVQNDPLAFTQTAYPWNVPGSILEKYSGPDEWSRNLFERIRIGLLTPNQAIQEATASGHGIGKSATVAWLILWAFCTYPDCRGTITANTEVQLKTKTWAELGKWFNLCFFARDLFQLEATALFSRDPTRKFTWRIDMVPWSKNNPAAFAGLHNQGKRILLVFDEASEIDDIIWETAEGALTDTDTQILWLVFGNPTRNTGRFRECFPGGTHADAWHSTQIDSRTVRITNKARFEQWIRLYGADSDFVRIRVLGQFPRRGMQEFFSVSEIDAAMSREVPYTDRATPLALGVDVARYGGNNSVLFPRKGRDARSIARRSYNGLSTTDLTNRIFDAWVDWRPDGIYIDGGGVGGGVVDQCRNIRLAVHEVQFGAKDSISGVSLDTSGERYANMRAAMYGAVRAWLKTAALPNDPELKTAMLSIRYIFQEKTGAILLVSKEDLLEDNPNLVLDDLDALALTFGGPLVASALAGGEFPHKDLVESEYDPYSPERLAA
jgi:hypothetical protein